MFLLTRPQLAAQAWMASTCMRIRCAGAAQFLPTLLSPLEFFKECSHSLAAGHGAVARNVTKQACREQKSTGGLVYVDLWYPLLTRSMHLNAPMDLSQPCPRLSTTRRTLKIMVNAGSVREMQSRSKRRKGVRTIMRVQ